MVFDLKVCPFCGKHFSTETENKEFVNRETVSYSASNLPSSWAASVGTNVGLDEYARTTVTKDVVRYKYTYKCKHCGYEWSEVKTEDA